MITVRMSACHAQVGEAKDMLAKRSGRDELWRMQRKRRFVSWLSQEIRMSQVVVSR